MKHLRCTEPDGSKISTWRNGSMKLIDVLISASNIQGPDAFFLFPGKSCAALGQFSSKQSFFIEKKICLTSVSIFFRFSTETVDFRPKMVDLRPKLVDFGPKIAFFFLENF